MTHYWIYILNCNNGSFYTGYTTDLMRRYEEHVNGTGKCKYTRSFKPLSIAQSWQISGNKSQAMKIEKFIKQLSKEKKQQLIANPNQLAEIVKRELCIAKSDQPTANYSVSDN